MWDCAHTKKVKQGRQQLRICGWFIESWLMACVRGGVFSLSQASFRVFAIRHVSTEIV